ncbi:uncharacterized protein [Panulirus ornatus]|uniref:uncharacterized protein n=1 Tax=Panulirus ornatus TaxID=150431 RepID=UPI003A88F183
MHPHIFAYTENTDSTTIIAEILSIIDNIPAIVVFLDLENVFKQASPLLILETLSEKGVQGRLIGWIQDYLTHRQKLVRFQGVVSSYKPLENGTSQEGIPSPTLFNVLIENLVKLPFRPSVKLLCYANNLQLILRGRKRFANAQHALKLVEQECNRLGLKLNPAKTRTMALCSTRLARQDALHSGNAGNLGRHPPVSWSVV